MNLWRLYKKFPYLEVRHRLVMQLPKSATLLEIGSSTCDRARLFKYLRPDLQVFATDIVDHTASAGPGISFFVSDLTKGLPGELENKIDFVTTMHLFEHLEPSGYKNAVREIRKVLKPGGVWYIETPGIRSVFFPSFSLGRGGFHGPINFYDDPSHIKPFSQGGLYYLLTNGGFGVARTGIARNLVFFLCSPFLILAGVLLKKRLWLSLGLFNLFGWSVFAYGTNLKSERSPRTTAEY